MVERMLQQQRTMSLNGGNERAVKRIAELRASNGGHRLVQARRTGQCSSLGAVRSPPPSTADVRRAKNVVEYAYNAPRNVNFHTFAHLLSEYDLMTRDEKEAFGATLRRNMNEVERRFCRGEVDKRHGRDLFRFLCYGSNKNADRAKCEMARKIASYGILDPDDGSNISDKAMIQRLDKWYDFADDSACEWNTELFGLADVSEALSRNRPIDGRSCRVCAHAFLRLNRTGMRPDLLRETAARGSTRATPPVSRGRRARGAPSTTTTRRAEPSMPSLDDEPMDYDDDDDDHHHHADGENCGFSDCSSSDDATSEDDEVAAPAAPETTGKKRKATSMTPEKRRCAPKRPRKRATADDDVARLISLAVADAKN